jgi:hypothetical protein
MIPKVDTSFRQKIMRGAGRPARSRGCKSLAMKEGDSAQYLKRLSPNSDVTVRDLESGETIAIKLPPVF